MLNNEPEKITQLWEKQTASQSHSAQLDHMEIREESLETITGGMNSPSPRNEDYIFKGSRGMAKVYLVNHDITLKTAYPSVAAHEHNLAGEAPGVWEHKIAFDSNRNLIHFYKSHDGAHIITQKINLNNPFG